MPPEDTEAHIGEIYRLFDENFAKIKVLLAENKKILDRDVFRPLKNTDRLTGDELEEFKENLLGTLLFRPSIYERLYYDEAMVRKLQQQIESLITVDREQLYREVFGKNVSLVLQNA